MKLKSFIVISASILLVGTNLFVISAKQGNVNCKALLSKTFSLNHFAYANDPGYYGPSIPTGVAQPNGIADCSILEVEYYNIDVKLSSAQGQKLKKYVDAGGSLSTANIPYVNGTVSISGGNNSNNSSSNNVDAKVTGTMIVDVRAAKPQYVYCDYRNNVPCTGEHPDPCNELKNDYRERAFRTFGI